MFDFANGTVSERKTILRETTRRDRDEVIVEIVRSARVMPGFAFGPVELTGIRITINDQYADLSLEEATLMLRLIQETIEAVKDTPPAANPFENKERWND